MFSYNLDLIFFNRSVFYFREWFHFVSLFLSFAYILIKPTLQTLLKFVIENKFYSVAAMFKCLHSSQEAFF